MDELAQPRSKRGFTLFAKNTGNYLNGHEKVVKEYPELTREDVSAALEFATQAVDDEKVIQRA